MEVLGQQVFGPIGYRWLLGIHVTSYATFCVNANLTLSYPILCKFSEDIIKHS